MPANQPELAPPGTPARPGPPDPVALLRSRSYLMLLVLAAILGMPISAAAYGFLALASYLQQEIFTHLPHGLGFSTEPYGGRCQPWPWVACWPAWPSGTCRGEAGPHRQEASPFMARRPRLSFPASSSRRWQPWSSVPCTAPRCR
jgi:hypothetical protein